MGVGAVHRLALACWRHCPKHMRAPQAAPDATDHLGPAPGATSLCGRHCGKMLRVGIAPLHAAHAHAHTRTHALARTRTHSHALARTRAHARPPSHTHTASTLLPPDTKSRYQVKMLTGTWVVHVTRGAAGAYAWCAAGA
jgi:hypothetical protein